MCWNVGCLRRTRWLAKTQVSCWGQLNTMHSHKAQPKHVNNEDSVFKGEQWLCIVIQRFHHKGETLCFSRCSCPPNRENTLFWWFQGNGGSKLEGLNSHCIYRIYQCVGRCWELRTDLLFTVNECIWMLTAIQSNAADLIVAFCQVRLL